PAESNHEASLRHIGHFAKVADPDYEPPQADHATSRDRFIDSHFREDIITSNAGHVHEHADDVVVAGPQGSGVTPHVVGGETEFGAGAGAGDESPPMTISTAMSDAVLDQTGATLDVA